MAKVKKENKLAQELTGIAMRQLTTCYTFKLPRVNQIRKFRALYNGQAEKQLRIRYNVTIPIFAGMIDTLQADLDDSMVLKFEEQDPADWKAAKKANAYIQKEMVSMRNGAMWSQKMRQARQEMIFSGRGFLKYVPSSENGYSATLTAPTFDDMFFEPKGGGQLENHLFVGQSDIWKSKKDLLDGVEEGIYDKEQVDKLLSFNDGNTYKISSYWNNYDFANRFLSLNLTAESNNYVGEPMFNMVEWCLTYKGIRWYLLFEAYSGTWVRCEKLTDVFSSGLYPWMSFASHEDAKNFASKGFADDLYPHARVMTDFFNEDMENRKRRNSNARAYDKDMFPNVAQLDEAQMGRDRLVSVDTKGGTRRIEEGIYTFQTPEITGTIDVLSYLEQMVGRNFGVTALQQGQSQKDAKVGVTLLENQQVSQRLSYQAQSFVEVGQQLGMRVFCGLKDYLREPLSIKMLGEEGYEWDTLSRIDLNIKRDFEITVTSQAKENRNNEVSHQKKINALVTVRNTPPANPNINAKLVDEYILRDAGLDEIEIGLILDPKSNATKETIAQTSEAIQDIMQGRKPKKNYQATAYFMQTILDFVKEHQDDKKIQKRMNEFMAYLDEHAIIAQENEKRRATKEAMAIKTGIMPQGEEQIPQMAQKALPAPISPQGMPNNPADTTNSMMPATV